MNEIPDFTSHGITIPKLGFGTGRIGDKTSIDAYGGLVAHALKLGYRHIDTAWKYKTEKGVGDGIRASGVPREEIFLTTKVSHEYLRADDFARMVDESLNNLKVDYVDLLMVHWPSPEKVPLAETMNALAKAKREGKTRHVGVANFNIAMLEEAMRLCPEPIASIQVEYHPYLDQTKLLAAVRRLGLPLTAYCPLGRGKIFNDPVLTGIASAKGKTVAQVVLRWHLQQPNVMPIPRSTNPGRQAENLNIFDFTLSDDEMKRIHALARPDGRIAKPADRAPLWD
jgi:diketogulonate reductase-like aldo/keto reductase